MGDVTKATRTLVSASFWVFSRWMCCAWLPVDVIWDASLSEVIALIVLRRLCYSGSLSTGGLVHNTLIDKLSTLAAPDRQADYFRKPSAQPTEPVFAM